MNAPVPQFAWKNDWHDRYLCTTRHDKIAGAILDKAKLWKRNLSGALDGWRRNYLLYHNIDPFTGNTGSFDLVGDDAEYLELRINHYRNLLSHMMNLIFSKRDAFKSIACNAEPESIDVADLFNAYLEEMFTAQRASRQLYRGGEYALVFGPGFEVATWDVARGSDWMSSGRGQQLIKTGGPVVRARSVLDATFDFAVQDWGDLPWYIDREAVNRFELLSQFPDHEEAILNAPSIDESEDYMPSMCDGGEETDQIFRWTLYARPVNSLMLPAGRRVVVIDGDDLPLEDDDNRYGEIPVVRMAPMEAMGNMLGYTPANDLAPCQLFYNVIMRAIATQVAANGAGSIMAPRGADLDLETLIGGANIVYYNPDTSKGGGKPETLNLLEVSPTMQQLPGLIERIMETISGVNAVARGNPQDSLKSGRALAIVMAQTVQFLSGFHQSKTDAGEDLANILLRMAQKWMTTDQVVAMIGESKFAKTGKLNSEALKKIARVRAEAVDPALYTSTGKMSAADALLETGAIKTPQEYFEVARTGNLEVMTNANVSMTRGIRDENAELLRGLDVPVLETDDHASHLPEHIATLDGPEARRNAKAGKMDPMLAHIMAHKRGLAGLTLYPTPEEQQAEAMQAQQPPQQTTPQGPQQPATPQMQAPQAQPPQAPAQAQNGATPAT